jgi:hypothetical protein
MLSYKDEKTAGVLVQDINKIMHSYTAHYAVTLSGKVLPTLFICLQERSSAFVPCICEEVKALAKKV